MNTHDKYELPPLPEWTDWPSTVADMSVSEIKESMQDYARAAIEADRQRRGEPAPEGFCLHEAHREHKHKTGEDCTCPKYIRHPSCVQHEVRKYLPSKNPWGVAPQPAEPVKRKRRYAQGTALGEFGIIPMCDQVDDEPVKVPSDDEIMSVVRYSTVGSAAIQDDEWCAFARAILARYGQQAHTSVPEPLKYGREWKDHYVTGWNNCRAAMLADVQAQQDDPTPEEEEAWQRMERRS